MLEASEYSFQGRQGLLSVITPVFEPTLDFDHFNQSHDSLRSQELPPGWAVEWILAEDGKTGVLDNLFLEDQAIQKNTAPRVGDTAATRNRALGLSSGSLIKTFDQGDVLTPGTLLREITIFQRNPEVQYIGSKALDLLPDGSTRPADNEFPEGIIQRGVIFDRWKQRDHRLPVHPATSI